MTYRLIIRIEAEADITDAAVWYQNQQPGLGEQFLAEIDAALVLLVEGPQRFPRLRRRPDVRRVLISRFPHSIFFVLCSDTIVIFRMLHTARHDREWKKSVPAG